MDKIILDLCGGTGAWSKPYADAGYDVRMITLPKYDVKLYRHPDNVYGILAAPPCTMFSLSRTTAKTPRDTRAGMELVESCLKIIWSCYHHGKPKFWAMENPLGLLRYFMGKPALTFHPCDYGNAYTKRTDVWGRFKEPKRTPIFIPDRTKKQLAKNNRILSPLPTDYKAHKITGQRSQAVRRAITPSGFAKAFFEANR